MKPFDFLSQTGLPLYAQSPAEVERLNFRYRFAVQPFLSQIGGRYFGPGIPRWTLAICFSCRWR